jgi:hypothetical protein
VNRDARIQLLDALRSHQDNPGRADVVGQPGGLYRSGRQCGTGDRVLFQLSELEGDVENTELVEVAVPSASAAIATRCPATSSR